MLDTIAGGPGTRTKRNMGGYDEAASSAEAGVGADDEEWLSEDGSAEGDASSDEGLQPCGGGHGRHGEREPLRAEQRFTSASLF